MQGGKTLARKPGISKSTGYINRVFTIEYDLYGMIQAYGIEFIHWLADEIHSGRINCRQDVDRWAAHVAIKKDYNFNRELSRNGHRYNNEGELEDFAA